MESSGHKSPQKSFDIARGMAELASALLATKATVKSEPATGSAHIDFLPAFKTALQQLELAEIE